MARVKGISEDNDSIDESHVVDAGPQDESVPEGYEDFGAEQTPFVVKEVGAVIQGELMGRHMRRKPTGKGSPYFYQIKVERECQGVLGSKKRGTQEFVTVNPGELISIDETETLKDLKDLTDKMDRGAKYNVYLKFLRKRELDGGNSFWEIKKGIRVLRSPGG